MQNDGFSRRFFVVKKWKFCKKSKNLQKRKENACKKGGKGLLYSYKMTRDNRARGKENKNYVVEFIKRGFERKFGCGHGRKSLEHVAHGRYFGDCFGGVYDL